MSRSLQFFYLLILLTTLLFTGKVYAQSPVQADSLFAEAQEQARLGNYKGSRMLLKSALLAAPDFTDAQILLGLTYAWEEKFDSARAVLVPLHEKELQNTDILVALANLELWSGNPEKSLEYTSYGIGTEEAAVPLLLIQARAHQQTKHYKKAEDTLVRVLEVEPSNVDALKLLEQVRDAGAANFVRVGYQLTTFNENFSAWQLGELEYARATPTGKYLGRISYADRYKKQSAQFEIDAYPTLTKNAYLYLNAGFSDGNLFPTYRAGAELYHTLPFAFEVSAGARLLSFPEENVMLLTGYLGKYFKKQWVSFRPFLQKAHGNWQTTGILLIRQYFNHADNHITLVLSQGSTPLSPVGLEEINRLGSSRVGAEAQFRAGKNLKLAGLFTYEYEEYILNSHRNRFTTGLSVQYKF